MAEVILDVRHLKTYFFTDDGIVRAVDDLSYQVHKGECVAIIGESGSGKSVSAMSVLRLVPYPPGLVMGGEVLFHGQDLLKLSDEEMASLRGGRLSIIFQEPMTSLNPVMTIGAQISEALMNHTEMSKAEAMKGAVDLLARMDIPNPEQRVKEYPHQFSGGMQQRAMIAMAMACGPELLFADEPTTALDVTVQAQVLEQLNALRAEAGSALVLITHNLGVVARYADSVKIVYGGRVVEDGDTVSIFREPCHPYTMALIRSVPRLDLPRSHGLHTIKGSPPDMSRVPVDCCPFAPRCPLETDICGKARPEPVEVAPGHFCACHNIEAAKLHRKEVLA